ncbi:MAG: hypothetical protein RLY43_560 [Bacteroidota bacterium]
MRLTKTLIVLVLILTAFGCSRKYCTTKYPCVEKDSTSYVEKSNIDTLYIPLPQDTVKIQSDINCPDQQIIYKDGKTEYKVLIKDKVLTVFRINKADSLRVIYAYKNTEEYKKLTEVKIVDKIVYKTPKIAWYSYGLNLLLVIFVTRKFWAKFIKFPI